MGKFFLSSLSLPVKYSLEHYERVYYSIEPKPKRACNSVLSFSWLQHNAICPYTLIQDKHLCQIQTKFWWLAENFQVEEANLAV